MDSNKFCCFYGCVKKIDIFVLPQLTGQTICQLDEIPIHVRLIRISAFRCNLGKGNILLQQRGCVLHSNGFCKAFGRKKIFCEKIRLGKQYFQRGKAIQKLTQIFLLQSRCTRKKANIRNSRKKGLFSAVADFTYKSVLKGNPLSQSNSSVMFDRMRQNPDSMEDIFSFHFSSYCSPPHLNYSKKKYRKRE